MSRFCAYISCCATTPGPDAPWGADERARKLGLTGVVSEALAKVKTSLEGRTVIVQHLAGRGYALDSSGAKVMADPGLCTHAMVRFDGWMQQGDYDATTELYETWNRWRDAQREAIALIKARGAKVASYEACPAYISREDRHRRLIELADMGVSEVIYDRTANISDYAMWQELKADADSLRLPIIPEGCLDWNDQRGESCMVIDSGYGRGAAYNAGTYPNAGWHRVDIIGLNLPKATADSIKRWEAIHKRGTMRYSIGAGQYDAVVGGLGVA